MVSKLRKAAGALGLAAAAAAGCGEADGPLAPRDTVRAGAAAPVAGMEELARYRDGGPGLTIGVAVATVGPEGGALRLGDFELVVPAGAVDRATQFSVRLHVNDPWDEYVMADFGPREQAVAVPLVLRAPYAGTTAEGEPATVVCRIGSEWRPLPSSARADGRLEARIQELQLCGISITSGITVAG